MLVRFDTNNNNPKVSLVSFHSSNMAEVSIEQVQAVLDDIGSRKKITTSAGIDKAPSGGEILLRSLLSKGLPLSFIFIFSICFSFG